MHREIIAFFDVDHTICRRATALAFIRVLMRYGYIKPWYLAGVPFLYLAYRLFSLRMDFLFKYSLPKLCGISRAVFEQVGFEAFETLMRNALFPGALREIALLRSKGIRVMLATSTPFEAVYPLAQFCGISAQDIIATQFAYNGGIFEGRLIGQAVYSRNKSDIVRTYAERSGVDLQYCAFYSDSIHDLPLLEAVGRPVAANPDRRLGRLAKKRGWQIKDFRK